MARNISIGVVIGLMAVTATITYMITENAVLDKFNEKVNNVSERQEIYNKLSEADVFARSYYVSEINKENLMDSVVKGYINGIGDPYAVYYTADEYSALGERNTGFVTGLGFVYDKDVSGYPVVTGVTSGSPAEEYGIAVGDMIMAVDNTNVIAYKGGYNEAVRKFSAPEGTKVKLYIKRVTDDGKSFFTNVDIVSSKIEITSVNGSVCDNVGYIRISQFNENTPEQLEKMYSELSQLGIDGLVIDLRDNSGGSMDAMISCAEMFSESGKELVHAYYKTEDMTLYSSVNERSITNPTAVLINNGTKGEAELFASILKECAQASLVGKSTYGKGVIEQDHKCSDGSVLRFSIANVQTASSGNFNGKGIRPDFETTLAQGVDPFSLTASERRKYDSQFSKAVEILGFVS